MPPDGKGRAAIKGEKEPGKKGGKEKRVGREILLAGKKKDHGAKGSAATKDQKRA